MRRMDDIMVPLSSERRHRLHGEEVPEVIEGLKLRLRQHLETTEDLPGATVAFRALYRLIEHKQGRPDYPEPVTWGFIEDYVGVGEELEKIAPIYGPFLARFDDEDDLDEEEAPTRQPGVEEEEDPAHV